MFLCIYINYYLHLKTNNAKLEKCVLGCHLSVNRPHLRPIHSTKVAAKDVCHQSLLFLMILRFFAFKSIWIFCLFNVHST